MVMEGGEAMETGLKVVSRKSFVQRFFSADYIDVPANAQILKLLSKQGQSFFSFFWFILFFRLCFRSRSFFFFFEHKQRCPLSPSVYSSLFHWHN